MRSPFEQPVRADAVFSPDIETCGKGRQFPSVPSGGSRRCTRWRSPSRLICTASHDSSHASMRQPDIPPGDLPGDSPDRRAFDPRGGGDAGCLIAGTRVPAGAAPASVRIGNAPGKRSGRRSARHAAIAPPARRPPRNPATSRMHPGQRVSAAFRKTSVERFASTASRAHREMTPNAHRTGTRRHLVPPRKNRRLPAESGRNRRARRSGGSGGPASKRPAPGRRHRQRCPIFPDRGGDRADGVAATVASWSSAPRCSG